MLRLFSSRIDKKAYEDYDRRLDEQMSLERDEGQQATVDRMTKYYIKGTKDGTTSEYAIPPDSPFLSFEEAFSSAKKAISEFASMGYTEIWVTDEYGDQTRMVWDASSDKGMY